MSSEKDKKLDSLRRDLFSQDEAVVMRALMKCRESGDASMVEPLILLFASPPSPTIQREVADMLMNLKVTKTEKPFMDALRNPELRAFRRDIVSFMWNSGVHPIPYLPELVEMACSSSLEETLEILTLIESADEVADRGVLQSCVESLAIQLKKHPSAENTPLLKELSSLLESQMQPE